MTQLAHLLPLVSLCLATSAFAHPPALLEVDNAFDGEAEVWIDGSLQATVPGDTQMRLDVSPGRHEVVVQRPELGFVLRQAELQFRPGLTAVMAVDTPVGDLLVRNEGTVPLKVHVGESQSVWIAPQTGMNFPVETGRVDLWASARDNDGVRRVLEEELWVEPGKRGSHTLRYTPPAPTQLVLKNSGHRKVRVVVGDMDRGWIAGGERLLLPVQPGLVSVRFYNHDGLLIESSRQLAARGQKTRVVTTGIAPRSVSPTRISSAHGVRVLEVSTHRGHTSNR